MSFPQRLWWLNVHKWSIIRGRYYALDLKLDYWSIALYISIGYFGISLNYLMPSIFSHRLESSGAVYWDQTVPLVEGCIIYKRVKQWLCVHADHV